MMSLSKKLGACSLAAGAAALGATSVANAALNIFDHRAAPFYPIVEYWDGGYPLLAADQTLAVLNVKTGAFQYVQDNLDGVEGPYQKYDENGLMVGDTGPIDDALLTNDTVWFKHRDVKVAGKGGAGSAVLLETATGGGSGTFDADGIVYNPARIPGSDPATWSPHDWYRANQDGTPLPLPADGASAGQVDGSLSYNDSSPTGYTGVISHGFGGLGYGSGTTFGDRWFSIGFKLEEADGTHYGWVALDPGIDLDRNRIRAVYGWAYETTPGMPAQLTWELIGDADGDGDVDDIDIDMMGDAIRLGSVDFATYDISTDGTTSGQDGVIDINDLDYLVRFWAQTSVGMGTEYGDFNLDGLVDVTDLTRLATNYGVGTMWAEGNANRNFDLVTDTTDLTILSTFFGFVAPDVIPEPMTLGLLALGASGVLARRSRTR